ncbi:MAG: 2-oxoacid:acceptor oxidoreductase family protein [Armatimonadota bacterium]|nr:MAG: 2-oxoacid:acceptor oxidoreductase family protein [Armatimonadota bacterium]
MRREIIISGFGGQGIVLTGQLLAGAATFEGRNVVWSPSHGPEMRGGESNCTVVVADRPIGSPVVAHPDTAIIMDRPSLVRLSGVIASDGLMMINSSLAPSGPRRRDLRVWKVPANHLAEEIGDVRVANIIMLGAFIEAEHLVSPESVKQALRDRLPHRRRQLLELNERALERGMRHVREAGDKGVAAGAR